MSTLQLMNNVTVKSMKPSKNTVLVITVPGAYERSCRSGQRCVACCGVQGVNLLRRERQFLRGFCVRANLMKF